MTSPDLSSRMEAAARAIAPDRFVDLPGHTDSECIDCKEARDHMRETARVVLEAAYPELFGDQPSAWLAPWEATKEMTDAARRLDGTYPDIQPASERAHYGAMRDAHLHLSPKHEEQDDG